MDRVVGLEGLNEDGDRLIDQVPYKGKHAEEITRASGWTRRGHGGT